jgi:predicted nucleic acid-binding protein
MKYGFVITGDIEIPDDAEILYDAMGEIRGFSLPNEDEILLLVAVEVNEGEKILSSDNELREIGCQITDYHIQCLKR